MGLRTRDKILEFLSSNNLRVEVSSGDEVAIYCPWHSNRETPALWINLNSGLFHCFNPSCGIKGSFRTFVQKFSNGKFNFQEIVESSDILSMLEEKVEEADVMSEIFDRVSLDYSNPEMVKKIKYLIDRGFNLEILKHFEIGWSEVQQRIVIPARDQNFKIVGFIGRALNDEHPKYKYTKGFPKASILYNLQNAKNYSSVIVVEGSLDAIKIHQAGFPNVVACLGANVTDGQINLIKTYFDEIIIFNDHDDAGFKMLDGIIDRCSEKRIFVAQYPEEVLDSIIKPDPGALNEYQIRQTITNKITMIDYLFNMQK